MTRGKNNYVSLRSLLSNYEIFKSYSTILFQTSAIMTCKNGKDMRIRNDREKLKDITKNGKKNTSKIVASEYNETRTHNEIWKHSE